MTSDETLQITLSRLSPVFIKQSYISRDPLLQVSNCYAYVELNNEADAEKLKNHLQAKNFTVDNKKGAICIMQNKKWALATSIHGQMTLKNFEMVQMSVFATKTKLGWW